MSDRSFEHSEQMTKSRDSENSKNNDVFNKVSTLVSKEPLIEDNKKSCNYKSGDETFVDNLVWSNTKSTFIDGRQEDQRTESSKMLEEIKPFDINTSIKSSTVGKRTLLEDSPQIDVSSEIEVSKDVEQNVSGSNKISSSEGEIVEIPDDVKMKNTAYQNIEVRHDSQDSNIPKLSSANADAESKYVGDQEKSEITSLKKKSKKKKSKQKTRFETEVSSTVPPIRDDSLTADYWKSSPQKAGEISDVDERSFIQKQSELFVSEIVEAACKLINQSDENASKKHKTKIANDGENVIEKEDGSKLVDSELDGGKSLEISIGAADHINVLQTYLPPVAEERTTSFVKTGDINNSSPEKLALRINEAKFVMDSVSSSLHDKNEEMKNLLHESFDKEILLAEDTIESNLDELCVLENLLLEFSKNHTFSKRSENYSGEKNQSTQGTFDNFSVSELQLVLWHGKPKAHLLQDITAEKESGVQDICTPTMPNITFSHFVQSQKPFYVQKIAEMVEELKQLPLEPKSTADFHKIIFHYLQMLEKIQQWLEFLETWILHISQLHSSEYKDECKIINDQLENLELQLSAIKEINTNMSEVLPNEMKLQVNDGFLKLAHQLESTKEFATSSFTQVSSWGREATMLEHNKTDLDADLHAYGDQLETMKHQKSSISVIEPLKRNIFERCSEGELLCLKMQNLYLNWAGYQTTSYENSLHWYNSLKEMAYVSHQHATYCNYIICKYELNLELLNQFLLALENILPTEESVTDIDDSRTQRNVLKDLLNSTEVLLWMMKEKSQLLSEILEVNETQTEFNNLISRVQDVVNKGKSKLHRWSQWEDKLENLMNLIENTSCSLSEVNEALLQIQPCNKDLLQYASYFKNVHWDMQKYSFDIERIKKEKNAVFSFKKCIAVEKSSNTVINLFQDLQGSIETKLKTVYNFPKNWMDLEKDLLELRNWLSASNKRMNSVCFTMKQNENNPGPLTKCLQRCSEIEAGFECRDNINQWIRHPICKKLVNMNNLEATWNLMEVSEAWDHLKALVEQTRQSLQQKILHLGKGDADKFLQSWIRSIEKSFSDTTINNIETYEDLKALQFKLCNHQKSLDVITNILSDEFWCPGDKETAIESENLDHTDSVDAKTHQLHLRVKYQFDKIETLVLQFKEHDRFYSELIDLLKGIDTSLDKMNTGMPQMNNTLLIERFQDELVNNEMIREFKKLGKEICETSESKPLKNIISCKQTAMDEYLSNTHSLIAKIPSKTPKHLKQLEEQQEAYDSCFAFLSDQSFIFEIFCDPVTSVERITASLRNILKDLKDNPKLIELSASGEALNQDQQIKVESLRKQRENLECRVSDLLKELDAFSTECIEFNAIYHELYDWLSKTQNEIIPMHLNKYQSFKELECVTEKMMTSKEQLRVLQDLSHKILENNMLHSLAQTDVKNKMNYLNSCFACLEKVLNYCQETLLTIHQETNSDKQALERAEQFLSDAELEQFSDTVPLSKKEIENNLSAVEVLLEESTSHLASLQYIRRKLILDGIADFELVKNTSKTLLHLRNTISKLSTFYLKLCKVYSACNSIPENISVVLKFLGTFKRLIEKTPSNFAELVTFYAELQVLGVYIHAHQNLIECIIKEGLQQCRVEDQRVSESFIQFVQKFQLEWDLLNDKYESKLHEVNRAVNLFQNYLHYINLIKMGMRRIEKDLKFYPRMLKAHEIKSKISHLQELIREQKTLQNLMENAETASDEVFKYMNVSKSEGIKSQILDLKKDFECQENTLKSALCAVNELAGTVDRWNSNLDRVEDYVTVRTFLNLPLPEESDLLKMNIQETEERIEKLNKTSALIAEVESGTSRIEREMFCSDFQKEIFSQQQIIKALEVELQKRIRIISEILNREKNFTTSHAMLIKWSEAIVEKLKKKYDEAPEVVLNKICLDIDKEIIEWNNLLEQVKSTGHSILETERESEIVSRHISTANAASSNIFSKRDKREQEVKRIIFVKDSIIVLQRDLNLFLRKSEQYLQSPIQLTEVSLKEIDGFYHGIKKLQSDIKHYEESISSLANKTDDLMNTDAESNAFSCYSERYLFQHISRSVINRWTLLKTLSSERFSHVTEVRTLWEDILTLLDKLEDFIRSKETIASEIDYSEGDHQRCVYLEGIRIFETLKHSFQDNIHLLHDVNSAYHKIEKKELDVNDYLKTRVLELNERWHNLYKKISFNITTISNVLQLWNDYEQLQQHLHLFLTETHLKLTNLEHSDSLNEEECNTIMNEFMLHEDVLKRFYSLANNLKHKSKCSVEDINSQVEEIQKYWSEVFQCLQTCKDSLSKIVKMSEKENVQELETVLTPSVTESDSVKDTIDSSSEVTHLQQAQTEVEETVQKEKQTLSFTDETLVSKSEADSKADSWSGAESEQIASLHPEHEEFNSTDLSKITTQQEFVKDILAALKEAEDRIESLEGVLTDITPSGIDETPPNYSRLLAACRSSIDVIQYLNNLLFENPLDESEKTSEADIQLKTEDMLHRWEKIENTALQKELRYVENAKRWKQFSDDLKDIEKWMLDTLQSQPSPTTIDADIEKFISLLQKHEILISEINRQKKTIIKINATGQLFISSSRNSEASADINEKLKDVNEHWSKLCSLALEWQNKLQAEFLQSSEFHNTICEMELWLEEAGEKIQSVASEEKKSDALLHQQHTELFALKQQLGNCSARVKTLLDVSGQLFSESGFEQSSYRSDGILEVQSKLTHILDHSQTLLLECTEALKFLSKSLMTYEVPHDSGDSSRPNIMDDGQPTRIKRCCNYLLRVARASFPIQAVLLLILGAAILLPKEEEELSCRLSNNFASSLNPMLRYPGGPPPV